MLLPLKQGLKLSSPLCGIGIVPSCYATSIKTRIETEYPQKQTQNCQKVVMLLPLKQGLKLGGRNAGRKPVSRCYATSIKTRIETKPVQVVAVRTPPLLCYFH